jgi:hypothetical protein
VAEKWHSQLLGAVQFSLVVLKGLFFPVDECTGLYFVKNSCFIVPQAVLGFFCGGAIPLHRRLFEN